MSSPSQSPEPERSDFAKKYGLMRDNERQKIKTHEHRSGLTPLLKRKPNNPIDKAKREILKYQREVLSGFTTMDLQGLDCLTTSDIKAESLSGIHAICSRDRWETDASRHPKRPLYRLDDGSRWIASNPRVWPKLEPALKLLTRLVDMVHEHPWFETLMEGDVKKVPSSRYPDLDEVQDELIKNRIRSRFYHYITAKARDPEATPDSRRAAIKNRKESVLAQFLTGGMDVTFGFFHCTKHPVAGIEQSYCDAVFVPSVAKKEPMIFLAYQLMIPLLRDDLSNSERLFEQFHIACVLFHEMMHACFSLRYNTKKVLRTPKREVEYYYEDEPVRELGWSGENAIFGGINECVQHRHINEPENNNLHVCNFRNNWPTPEEKYQPHLENPGTEPIMLKLPVNLTYVENMFSSDYWEDFLRRYGMKMIALPNTPTAASYKTDYDDDPDEWKFIQEDYRPLRGDYAWRLRLLHPEYEEQQAYAKRLDALLQLTPNERVANAERSKADLLGKYQVMTRYRELIQAGHITYWENLQEERSEENVQRVIDVLDESAEVYSASLAIICRMKQVDRNLFNSRLAADRKEVVEFLIWLKGLKDDSDEKVQKKYRLVYKRVAKIRSRFNALDSQNPPASLDSEIARYTPDYAEQEAMVRDAENALAAATVDVTVPLAICEGLCLSRLGRIDLIVRALLVVGSVESVELPTRMARLERALKIITSRLEKPDISVENANMMTALHQKAKNLYNYLKTISQELGEQVEEQNTEEPDDCGKRKKKRKRSDSQSDVDK